MSDGRRSAWKGFLPDHAIVMGKMGEQHQPSAGTQPECPVVGTGNLRAALLFVMEGDDQSSESAQNQLFDRMLAAIGLNREQVYFCALVQPSSAEACRSSLLLQLDSIRPKVVVALGLRAAQLLLSSEVQMSELRGRFHDCNGAKLKVTHHLGELLQNPNLKREAWADLQSVAQELGLVIPGRGGTR